MTTEELKTPASRVTINVEQPKPENSEPKPDFWELVNSISDEDWNDHIVYLYRREPRTSMVRGTSGSYLEVLTTRFSPEDVKRRHGGGVYEAWLLGNGGKLRKSITQFEIAGEPRYDFTREVPPGSSAGAAGLSGDSAILNRFVDVLREQMESMRSQIVQSQAAPQSNAAAIEQAISMMKIAAENAMAMVVKQTPTQPNIAEMISAIASMNAQIGGGGNDVTKLLLNKLLDRVLAGPETNMLDQVDKLLLVAEKLSGRGGAERSLATALVDRAPEIITQAAGLFDRWRDVAREQRIASEYRYAAMATARGGSPPPPGRGAAVELPAQPSRPLARPTPSEASTAPAPRPMEVEPLGAPIVEQHDGSPSLDWVKRKIVWQIQQGVPGESVIDFIAGIDPGLVANLEGATKDQIRSFFQSDPILQESLASPHFNDFLDEALGYLAQNKADRGAPVQ